MILDDDARYYLFHDLTLTVDPTGSDVVLEITLDDVAVTGSPFAMTWQGTPTEGVDEWSQTARTDARFCGPNATPEGSDVQVDFGWYVAQALVTLDDGQIVPGPTKRLQVR